MSTAVVLQKSAAQWEAPPAKVLDESVWRAWIAKGRAEERRTNAAFVKSVTWISIAALLVTAGLWSSLTRYEIVVKFIVTACSIVLMLQSVNARHYAFAAVFGLLAVVYNPVAPMFSFSTDWQRALVVASAVPFAVSVASQSRTEVSNA